MFEDLIDRCKAAGYKFEFFGPQDDRRIDELAIALGVALSPSFRDFLRQYGGGGIVGEWISGIYSGQPLVRQVGTVYGDTLRMREQVKLPPHLVVIYTQDDEVVWCLDTTKRHQNGENPVVSFDISGRSQPSSIADSFGSFFRDYLEMHK